MYPASFGKFVDPRNVVSHFHLHEGDIVADVGAGSGHYLKPLADAVGGSGKVYACEIQKNLVEALGVLVREKHLSNVFPLWCDIEAPNGTKLKDGSLDVVLLSNILFQFTNKESALTEVFRVLRKGGKLLLIDWVDSSGGLGPRREDVVSEDTARALLIRMGYVYDHSFPAGDHHYGLMCHKQ